MESIREDSIEEAASGLAQRTSRWNRCERENVPAGGIAFVRLVR